MPAGPGGNDANGVRLFGEADTQALFSDLLNLGMSSVSAQFVVDRLRMTTAEARSTVLEGYAARGWRGIIPTIANTGGTAAVNSTDGEVTASGAITMLRVTIPSSTSYKAFRGHLRLAGGTSGSHTLKLCSGATPDATASSYRGQSNIAQGTSWTMAAFTAVSTGWPMSLVARKLRELNFTIDNLSAARKTRWVEWGMGDDDGSAEINTFAAGAHQVASAFDGFQFDFSSMGTFTDLSLTLEGLL